MVEFTDTELSLIRVVMISEKNKLQRLVRRGETTMAGRLKEVEFILRKIEWRGKGAL